LKGNAGNSARDLTAMADFASLNPMVWTPSPFIFGIEVPNWEC
jgi:hypothetical protein